jgi:hypothetical protein
MQSSCMAQKPQSLGQAGSRPAELGTRGAFPSWSLGTREKWKTGVDHQPRPHLLKTGKQRTRNSKLGDPITGWKPVPLPPLQLPFRHRQIIGEIIQLDGEVDVFHRHAFR